MLEVIEGSTNYNLPEATVKQFFYKYVEFMQTLLGGDKALSEKQIKVMGELLYHNHLKRDIKDVDDRATLVFNSTTRKKIQEALGTIKEPVSYHVIQQALNKLRDKGYLKGIKIPTFMIPKLEGDTFKLSFTFKIKE